MKITLMLSLFIALALSTPALAKKTKRTPASASEGAPATFSAFAHEGNLYVTVLGDCNNVNGSLDVNKRCRSDRGTRDAALICEAKLELMQTVMACPKKVTKAHLITIDLEEEKVAPEARELHLTVGEGAPVIVRLK